MPEFKATIDIVEDVWNDWIVYKKRYTAKIVASAGVLALKGLPAEERDSLIDKVILMDAKKNPEIIALMESVSNSTISQNHKKLLLNFLEKGQLLLSDKRAKKAQNRHKQPSTD